MQLKRSVIQFERKYVPNSKVRVLQLVQLVSQENLWTHQCIFSQKVFFRGAVLKSKYVPRSAVRLLELVAQKNTSTLSTKLSEGMANCQFI